MHARIHAIRLAAAAILSLAPLAAFPQAYPTKPVRMIVPYPPGGIDVFIRAVVPRVGEALGQPLVIENRGGANGFIGAEMLAKSAPDGHSIGFMASATVVGGPALAKAAPFDPLKDFTPVIQLVETTLVLTAFQSLQVNSVQELIDYAKRNPGKLSFNSSGVGSAFHLNGEKMKLLTGIDMVHVPSKGSGPMATELLSGRVEVGFPALNNVAAYLSSGKLKVLAVMARKRSPELPGVPTIGEAIPGFPPQTPFHGVYGPAGLPQPIVTRLNGLFNKAAEAPEFRQLVTKSGAVVVGGPPEQLAETLRTDLKEVTELVHKLGIPRE
jgi:tripartite-type tricarboxylate transporter receptor subunit TctC